VLNACTLPPPLGCMNVFQGRVAGHAGRQRRVVCVRLRMDGSIGRKRRERRRGCDTATAHSLSLAEAADVERHRRRTASRASRLITVPGSRGGCCIIAFAAHLINAAAAIRCESDAPVGRFSRSSLACCGRKIEPTPARPPLIAQCPRANIVCVVCGEFSRRRHRL